MSSQLRIVGLVTFALGLLATLALSASKAQAGDEQFDAHLCAAVYSAVASDPTDQNYQAMQFRYYAYSDYSSQEAALKEITRAAAAVRTEVREGRVEPAALLNVVKECARVQKIPAPDISYNLRPGSSAPSSSAPSSSAAATGPSQAGAACESASERYQSTLRAMPDRLAAKGPRAYKDCDRPGPMCNVVRNNSAWYYEMGKICTELKPIQEDIRRYCGETVADLDDC